MGDDLGVTAAGPDSGVPVGGPAGGTDAQAVGSSAGGPVGGLTGALTVLRDRVVGLRFGLATPATAAAARTAATLVEQVDDYLLPRLASLDAPLLVVVGGSTGAGKSTLVNSLVGAEVTTPGVLRPTTRAPVLVCAEADLGWFAGDRVLPGLARTTGAVPGTAGATARAASGGATTGAGSSSGTVSPPRAGLSLRPLADLLPGLALLDAPDVDSVVVANRDLAAQLLAAADLWVFATTAARYADAVPWDLLHTAQERATALAVVLDRVPPEAVEEVAADLRGMLDRAGLSAARLFVIEERVLVDGRLPEDQLRPMRTWLRGLASDRDARAAVVRQTLGGALDSLDARVDLLAAAADQQTAAAQGLAAVARASYAQAARDVEEDVRHGSLLRGEVLARWQEFVGTGEWMRGLQSRVGDLRDRVTAALTGRPAPGRALQGALESSVETLLVAAADAAAERTTGAWRAAAGGSGLLAGRERELDRATDGFAARAAAEVRDWQGLVLDLVREQGAGKRTTARLLSFGVNGAGLAVMVALFAQTGGLTGGEIAIAGGTSAVGQRLLEAVFGDAAVRSLALRAREDLGLRASRLLAAERHRFDDLLDRAVPDAVAGDGLRAAMVAVRAAR